MKLITKSVVVLAVAAAGALGPTAVELARPAMALAAFGFEDPDRHEGHGHEAWSADLPSLGFAPHNAAWDGMFDANWR